MRLGTFNIDTGSGQLRVHRATAVDFDAVFGLMVEAATWLQSRGISQWSFFFTEPAREFVRKRIVGAETYLIFDTVEQPVGTFALYWKDEEAWGRRGLDGEAGYVHGLAVSRPSAGKELGYVLLGLASKLIARKSRALIRLDCMAQNEALCGYYRRAGFVDMGVSDSNITGKSLRLFQRAVRVP
jgi:ribosomal protein S18 acetylase RimI-like enzyme